MKQLYILLLDYLVYAIIFIKLLFIFSSLGHWITSNVKDNENVNQILAYRIDENLLYWKERTEFIFMILMSILLILHFNPHIANKIHINAETSLLFYMFGIILIISAKWELFFYESKWYQIIQDNIR